MFILPFTQIVSVVEQSTININKSRLLLRLYAPIFPMLLLRYHFFHKLLVLEFIND